MKLKVDFHRDSMQGQMRPEERRAMYNIVVDRKPSLMIEIGTWKGGGSTYILGCAAHEYGGHIHTIEANKDFHASALRLFDSRMQILLPYIDFHLGFSQDVLPDILNKNEKIDFILFDGAEDPDQTVLEYEMVEKHLKKGAVMAFHDWKTSKTAKIKGVLANDPSWKIIVQVLNTDTGFCMFERG